MHWTLNMTPIKRAMKGASMYINMRVGPLLAHQILEYPPSIADRFAMTLPQRIQQVCLCLLLRFAIKQRVRYGNRPA